MYAYSADCHLYKSVSMYCLYVNCFSTVWMLWLCDNKSDLIILYINCGHHGAAIMPGILNARPLFSFTFTFEIHDRSYSVHTMERQFLPHILQD